MCFAILLKITLFIFEKEKQLVKCMDIKKEYKNIINNIILNIDEVLTELFGN